MQKNIRLPAEHLSYFETIGRTGDTLQVPTYVVGGYVRDLLLGRTVKDIDVVCVGNGIDLAKKSAQAFPTATMVTVFHTFGTAMFRVGDVEIEFVGARKESYQADSRKPAVEDGTLSDDLLRRDFSINAMAICLNSDYYGELIDPFDGIGDLEKGIIRTPTDANITFSDDPLRMLRAIRFATQLNFVLEKNTYTAIRNNRQRIHIISAERIHTELNKIIAAPRPSVGFKYLFDTLLLHEFFPELAAMQGIEVRNGVAHKDNFYHTLTVLDNIAALTDNLWLRWAALLHDIAKPLTKRFDEEQQCWTFHNHEYVGMNVAKQIFKRLKLPLGDELKFVQKMIGLHQRPMMLTKDTITESAVRRILFEAGEDIDSLMALCHADITSKIEWRVKKYIDSYTYLKERMAEIEAKDQLRNWQPPISGEIIMETFNIKPCRQVGIVKDAIREAILDGIIPNDYQVAYHFMLQKGQEIGLTVHSTHHS